MRTKIVYVLVSQESDYYYEMFLLSHYSLRLYHPKGDAEVVLVMDTDTHQRLVDEKVPILDDVTLVVVDIPEEYTKMQRSRYLKTTLRKRVNGDFLFIDTDTIICDKLDDIDEVKADIAAIAEGKEGLSDFWYANFQKADMEHYSDKPFYNSGVMYVKDCVISFRIYEDWHLQWKKSIQYEMNYDQPSLCWANAKANYPMKELSVIWNCSLERASTKVFVKAKIFHYFNNTKGTLRSMLMERIRENGVNDSIVRKIAQNPLTIGRAAFLIKDDQIENYLYSEMLNIYDSTPPLFNFYIQLSHILTKPIRIFSKIKQFCQWRKIM